MANSLLMLKDPHALCSMPRWIVPRNRIEPIDRDAVIVVDVPKRRHHDTRMARS